MASTHFHLPCPGCQHPSKVRRGYVGLNVQCKYCGVTFRIDVPDDPSPGPEGEDAFTVEMVAPAPEAPRGNRPTVAVEREEWERLQQELISLRSELDDLKAHALETATAEPEEPALPEGTIAVDSSEWDRLHQDLESLRVERDQQQEVSARAQVLEDELAAARREAEARSAESAELREAIASQRKSELQLTDRITALQAGHDSLSAERDRVAGERGAFLEETERRFAEERARSESAVSEARAELETVRSEAARERTELQEELARIQGESERSMTDRENSAHRIEQLVRDHEEQVRQRREVEATLQRLEERQREDLAQSEAASEASRQAVESLTRKKQQLADALQALREEVARSQHTQKDLAAERGRAVELLYAAQTEHAQRVNELERQLEANQAAANQTGLDTKELTEARADLKRARAKIQELSELLETSEEKRISMQETLLSFGILVP